MLDDDEEDVEAEGPLRSSTREERSEAAVDECDCPPGESGGTVVMVAGIKIGISTTNALGKRSNGAKRGERVRCNPRLMWRATPSTDFTIR